MIGLSTYRSDEFGSLLLFTLLGLWGLIEKRGLTAGISFGLAAAIKGDLVKGIGHSAEEQLPGLENIPPVAATIPKFFVGAWTIMLAPSGTPDPIIRKVSKDMWTALNAPEVKDKYQANGAFIKFMSPEDTTKFVQDEQTTWRPILEQVARETPK